MTRHIALAAALAAIIALPSVASAAPVASSTQLQPMRSFQVRRANERAESYTRRAESEMSAARTRIQGRLRQVRMTTEKRQRILNDVNWAASILRNRIQQRGADGWITAAEHEEIGTLHEAVRKELQKAHGNFDSWKLLK